MPRHTAWTFAALAALAAPTARAQAPAPPPRTPVGAAPAPPPAPASRRAVVSLVAEAGIEYGGDDLLTVQFTNGDDQTLLAGQGATLAVGVEVQPRPALPVTARATLGFKFALTAADNANIAFTRIPLEGVVSYRHRSGVRLGAGVSHHARVRLNGDGFLPDADFGSATGPTVEIGYKLLALTASRMAYRAPSGERLDASSLGLTLIAPIRRF